MATYNLKFRFSDRDIKSYFTNNKDKLDHYWDDLFEAIYFRDFPKYVGPCFYLYYVKGIWIIDILRKGDPDSVEKCYIKFFQVDDLGIYIRDEVEKYMTYLTI